MVNSHHAYNICITTLRGNTSVYESVSYVILSNLSVECVLKMCNIQGGLTVMQTYSAHGTSAHFKLILITNYILKLFKSSLNLC